MATLPCKLPRTSNIVPGTKQPMSKPLTYSRNPLNALAQC